MLNQAMFSGPLCSNSFSKPKVRISVPERDWVTGPWTRLSSLLSSVVRLAKSTSFSVFFFIHYLISFVCILGKGGRVYHIGAARAKADLNTLVTNSLVHQAELGIISGGDCTFLCLLRMTQHGYATVLKTQRP